ncbi:hypothetical protein, partial [Intrasporangium sp.]|uniref:hypothetical protein n=1 Tax=Intrasporangium sp. TaxID=1925024 RepID=UPI0033654136
MHASALGAEPGPSRFLNWGGRLGGLLVWLGAGLLPIAYDLFDVLPVPGLIARFDATSDRFMPGEATGYTLAYLAIATVVYQAAVTPEARLNRETGGVVVVGPLFTTKIPLALVDAVRVQPGVPNVAADGRDIPVYALISSNLPELGPFRRRRQKAFRDAVLAARSGRAE